VSIISYVRSDRRLTLAAVVVIVFAAGVLSAASVDHRPSPRDAQVRAAGEIAGVLAADATTTTGPSAGSGAVTVPASSSTVAPSRPTTTPTTRRPAPPVTTAGPAPAVTTAGPVVRSTPANFSRDLPGAAVVPFAEGQTSWTGVSNGITITVRSDSAAPRAGTPIEFAVEASAAVPCCQMSMWFGDGFSRSDEQGYTCPPAARAVGPVTFRASHTYNLDGRWTFAVSAGTPDCGATIPDGTLFGSFDVGPGKSTAQGPALPQVTVDQSTRPPGHDEDYSWVSMAGQVLEDDGWIRSVTLDWGDGSPTLPLGGALGPTECQSTLAGWPAPSRMVIFTGKAVHHYAAPGSYMITVTAVSTACDGTSAPQTGIGTHLWQVPA
jgi:hypothetical protein